MRSIQTTSVRWSTALTLGIVLTLVLFWLMQSLIQSADATVSAEPVLGTVDFIKRPVEDPVPPPDDPPIEPPMPVPPPPAFELSWEPIEVGTNTVSIQNESAKPTIKPEPQFVANVGDGAMMPVVKIAPAYPPQAIHRGLEGYCVIEYTVTSSGGIKNPRVVHELCSHTAFRKPSIKAALQFKYQPRIVNGNPIETEGVRNKFTFEIDG